MGIANSLVMTVVLARFALFPTGIKKGSSNKAALKEYFLYQNEFKAVRAAGVRDLLKDLSSAIDHNGILKLYFPGAVPIVAPLLLFRLKREGYSHCKVTVEVDGLKLTACR